MIRKLRSMHVLLGFVCAGSALSDAAAAADGTPAPPSYRELWTREQTPFRIYGNTYYVGTRGLSSMLVTSDDGHVLIDGTLPENAKLIAQNIRRLGFRIEDVKLIVNSHTHSDHAGGIAELQRASGAKLVASPIAAKALQQGHGGMNDPQHEYGDSFPPIASVETIADGKTLEVGDIRLTVHFTPGHTPGGTSWTWRSCENDRCLNMVYADSLTAVSDDTFKFTGDARYPTALKDFTRSIERVAALSCDVLVAAHPESVQLWDRLERREHGDRDAFVDADACKRYAQAGRERLEKRIAREKAEAR